MESRPIARPFLRRRLVDPIVELLRQGITPRKIALSIALGIVLGVTPVLGSTTLLCLAAAAVFRLNLPAIQLVNYLVYPLQLALLIPFVRMGEWIFGVEPSHLSLAQALDLIRADAWGAMALLWTATLRALVAWLVIGSIATLAIYLVLAHGLARLSRSIRVKA